MPRLRRFSLPPHVTWPAFVILLLLMSVGVSFAAVFAARSDGGADPVDDYYAKAAAYDRLSAEQRASDALGWTLTATVAPGPSPALRTVSFGVVDAAGRPVEALRGLVTAARPQRVVPLARVPLTPAGPGRYQVTLPYDGAGLYDLALDATRDAAHFLAATRVSVR